MSPNPSGVYKGTNYATSKPICVLVADSSRMRRQLVVSAFRRHPEFRVASCEMEVEQISANVAESRVDVTLISGHQNRASAGMATVRRIHLSDPGIAQVLLLENPDRDSVVNAFRCGVQGLFCLSIHPFRLLCRCVQAVHQGQIWISNEHLRYLIDAVTQVPSLRMVNAHGLHLLTPREEQVVALVADGLSNRETARELHLSEHTIKKYLFRIFDKIGISSRVELVLYAVNNGDSREAEWIPSGAD